MSDATFTCPDLTTFCRLDELGLEAVGQRLEPDHQPDLARVRLRPVRRERLGDCSARLLTNDAEEMSRYPVGVPAHLELAASAIICKDPT